MSERQPTFETLSAQIDEVVLSYARKLLDHSRAIRVIRQRDELVIALEASEREYENLDESAPLDAGCIECTVGTVPNNLNTGLCAHHLRVAALARVRGDVL